MALFYTCLFFIYGLIFGSFFNVVGLRVPKKESIIAPPSHCPICNHRLGVLDLIPVLSYVFLRGKCRKCKTKISAIYPFMELMTGLLFAFSYWMIGFQIELLVALLFVSLLIIITVSDIQYMLIPNKILLPFGIVLLILRFIFPLSPWWDSLAGAMIGFGLLLFIGIVSKGGMGGGDIKLFFVIGLVLGTLHTVLTLFLAALIGSVIGLIILRIKGKGRKIPIPFGPSIAFAALIAYFFGTELVDLYGNLFF